MSTADESLTMSTSSTHQVHPLLRSTAAGQDPAVRAAQLASLRRSISAAQAALDQWTGFQADYQSLKSTLVDLPTRVSHQVMVPLGPLAFMPGKLVHTNEITVLLGDNWFVERSAAQAVEIVQRRMDFVAEKLQDAKSTVTSLQSKLQAMDPTRPPVPVEQPEELPEINEEGLPFMDIREDVDNPTIPTKTLLPPLPVSPALPASSKKSSKAKKNKQPPKRQEVSDPLAHARQVVAQFAATGVPPPMSAEDRAALDAMFDNLSIDEDEDDEDDEDAQTAGASLTPPPATPAVQSAVVERTPPPAIDTASPATLLATGPLPRKSSLKKSSSNLSLESRHVRWAMDEATTEEDSSACPTPTTDARGVFTNDDEEEEDAEDDFDDDGDQVQVLLRPSKPTPAPPSSSSSSATSVSTVPLSRSAWAAAAAKRTAARAATTAANLPHRPPEPHAHKQSRRTNVPVRDTIVERHVPPPLASPTASSSGSATDVEPSPPAPASRSAAASASDPSADVDDYTHLREIATAYHAQRQHLVHQMLSRSPLEPKDLADAADKQFTLSPVDVARAELVAEYGSGPGFDPLMEMVIKKEVREGEEPLEEEEEGVEDQGIGYRLPIVDDVNGEIHLPVRRVGKEENCGDVEGDVGPVRVRLAEKDDDKGKREVEAWKMSQDGVVGQVREVVATPERQSQQQPKRVSKFKQARMSKQ